MESAVGIPGSVGGAAVMNAGAYGFSISDVLREIVVYDPDGERTEPPEGWRFHYRGSSIPEGSAVASVSVGLRPGDPEELGKEIRELQMQRVKSQPAGRNAGCVFKNPPGGHAGEVIDRLGLKGTRARGRSEREARQLRGQREGRHGHGRAGGPRPGPRARGPEAGVEPELEVKVWRPRA
jgi:UDP-N-acetylmuramate dehydrogenase